MKGTHKGDRSLYTDQRDQELLLAYNRAKARSLRDKGYIIHLDAVNDARCSPASRFFVSESRAAIVLKELDLHMHCIDSGIKASDPNFYPDPLSSISRYQTRRMYSCLYDVYCRLRDENPDTPHAELVVMATAQPAPEFFLTLDSARAILGYIHVNTRRHGLRISDQRRLNTDQSPSTHT